MENNIQYKDYFSLKTLSKHNINPNESLNLNDNKDSILKTFGELSKEEKTFLSNRIDNACKDQGIVLKEKIRIDIKELDEDLYTPIKDNKNEPIKERIKDGLEL